MSFESVEKKIMRPPAAHNFARLIDPSCEMKTTQKIAEFSVGIPPFNYIPAISMCKDRVKLKIDRKNALYAVRSNGAPKGREQNASLVNAFFDYDETRGYSDLRVLDDYEGQYRISREIFVPTRPTFTILENGKQVPVIICGWQKINLTREQMRIWITILDSGLFSYADYRNSPWEIITFPEINNIEKFRSPMVIRSGDYSLLSEREMRELSGMYSRAQQAAMPIARELWERRQERRREKEKQNPHPANSHDAPGPWQDDLFQ